MNKAELFKEFEGMSGAGIDALMVMAFKDGFNEGHKAGAGALADKLRKVDLLDGGLPEGVTTTATDLKVGDLVGWAIDQALASLLGEMELAYCAACNQMTNHRQGKCLKCGKG